MPDTPNLQPFPLRTLRVAGHFGELMQGRLGPDGPLALISLPCPELWVECGPQVIPDDTIAGPGRLAALCHALELPVPDRRPGLRATMPLGGGAGSSTAGLVAFARALGYVGSDETLAKACAQIEGASDPLMFAQSERLLFAPRDGRVLRALPAIPRFVVVGGFHGPVQRTDPADLAFPDIADLVAQWQPGMSLAVMAGLVTTSARRTLALRGPHNDPTDALATELGALGWLTAHTGNARGLIFAPGPSNPDTVRRLRDASFADVIRFDAGGTP